MSSEEQEKRNTEEILKSFLGPLEMQDIIEFKLKLQSLHLSDVFEMAEEDVYESILRIIQYSRFFGNISLVEMSDLISFRKRTLPDDALELRASRNSLLFSFENDKVIKLVPVNRSSKHKIFMEVFINEYVRSHQSPILHFRVPAVYDVYMTPYDGQMHYAIVMEKMSGQPIFQHLQQRSLTDFRDILQKIYTMIGYLQNVCSFMHRDFHSGNVWFDAQSDNVWLFDFGESCVSFKSILLNCKTHVVHHKLDDLKNTRYRSCSNLSFDLSVLIASLGFAAEQAMTRNQKLTESQQFIQQQSQKLFQYLNAVIMTDAKRLQPNYRITQVLLELIADPVSRSSASYIAHFNGKSWPGLFHYHQVYRTIEIQINEFTPSVISLIHSKLKF